MITSPTEMELPPSKWKRPKDEAQRRMSKKDEARPSKEKRDQWRSSKSQLEGGYPFEISLKVKVLYQNLS